eukprot:3695532-Alexandrium_andersonii.AAC.1
MVRRGWISSMASYTRPLAMSQPEMQPARVDRETLTVLCATASPARVVLGLQCACKCNGNGREGKR